MCIVSRNEGHLLPPVLKAVADWAANVIVMDMASSDDTRELAIRYGATVVDVPLVPVVERVRQVGLDASSTDWLVYLDPDEIPPPSMANECRAAIEKDPEAAAFRWPFVDTFFGVPLRQSRSQARKIVLLHTGRVRYGDTLKAHEEPDLSAPVVNLEIDDATPILHHTFRTVSQMAEKMTRYATTGNPLLGHGLEDSDVPLARLLFRHVVLGRSWRDGRAGVEAASISALHDYLASMRKHEHSRDWSSPISPTTRLALGGGAMAWSAAVRVRNRFRRVLAS